MLIQRHRWLRYIFLLVVAVSSMGMRVFALEQLNPLGSQWSNRAPVVTSRAMKFTPPGIYYRIYYTNNSWSNRAADGFIYHQFTVPGPANASFTWSYKPYDSGSGGAYELSIRYGTSSSSLSGDQILVKSTNANQVTVDGDAAKLLNSGTYYAKAYVSANIRRLYTGEGHIYNLKCNLSPTGLSGNLSNDGVSLSWQTSTSPVVTLSKYNVYCSETSGSGYVKLGETTSTSFVARPNVGNKTLYFVITDVDTNGVESPFSKEVSLYYPKPPYNLTASVQSYPGGSTYFMSLDWQTNPPPYSIDHNVFRSGVSGSGYVRIGGWGTETNYRDTTPVEGNLYYYVVNYTYWLGGNQIDSPYSEEVSALYLLPPTGLSASYQFNFDTDLYEVVLSWNQKSVSNFQDYKIYRSTSLNGTYDLLATIPDNSVLNFTDFSIVSGNSYYYKISCSTDLGESPLSEAVEVFVYKNPQNLAITTNGANHPVLTWEAPNPANPNHDGYKVYRATSQSGPFTQIDSIWGVGTTYTDNSVTLSDGDGYYYYVTEFGWDHETGPSNIAGENNIAPPTNLIATGVGGSAELVWNPSSSPMAKLGGYNIYRSTSSGGPYTFVNNVDVYATSYSDGSVSEDVDYYYVVRTYNINGAESLNSNEDSCNIPVSVRLSVHIDDSIPSEIVLTDTDVTDIPVNWTIDTIAAGAAISSYKVTICYSDGAAVQSSVVTSPSATSHTVGSVLLRDGRSYIATVEVFYTVNGGLRSSLFSSENGFSAVTPKTIEVRDGWSGKDIACSFFENRVEANWDHDSTSSFVKYELAVGTSPYGTEVLNWQDIGLVSRIAVTTPELASGTRYYTSVRGLTQNRNVAISGCSDGFIARRDSIIKDTNSSEFFNNARVLENLSTDNGKLTPSGEIGSGNFKYYMPVTITEPGVIDRINAPCLINFSIPSSKRPYYIREFRVTDDQGNIVPRYNLTSPNNSTTSNPYLVLLVNIKKGESRTYYVYWGNGQDSEPNYGFTDNTDKNSLNAWTPYYSRLDVPAGLENVNYTTANKLIPLSSSDDDDDGTKYQSLTPGLSGFRFFGEDRSGWYLCINGFMSVNNNSGYSVNATNRFDEFVGNANEYLSDNYIRSNGTTVSIKRKNLGRCICPLWCDLQMGSSWEESGLFRENLNNPKRVVFTWVAYRYKMSDDAYKFQAVLYETGDIAIRYGLLNPRALVAPLTHYDLPINTSQNTAGISNGSNQRYLYHTPLRVGINQNPTAFYQCMNAFDGNISYGEIVGDGAVYDVAHFESMVFDTRMSQPQWTSLQYDASVTGNRQLGIYYRTGNSQFLDAVPWSGVTNVTSTVTNGEIPIMTTGRYIQYRVDFKKTGNSGSMSLDEVRFIYGGISIEDITAVDANGNAITKVSQGQVNIPVKVAIKNTSPVVLSLSEAELDFTLGGHSAALVEPALPVTILAGEIATLTYNVSIAADAPTGECIVDATAKVTELLKDDGAQNTLKWVVNSKSVLVVDQVYSSYTKVTKNHSYDLYVTITNTGEADCMLTHILPTYASGTYAFTLDTSYGVSTGTVGVGPDSAIIHGKETRTAKFSVHILPESKSGTDTLGAVASAANMLSGELIEVLTTVNPHIWTIQKPAELNLYSIEAPAVLYRGQKNNKITLIATNEGEAELDWYPGSSTSKINFTTVTGLGKSYINKKILTAEEKFKLTSETVARADYSVDLKPDTATGTDRITSTIYGIELNTNDALSDGGSLPFAEWTIYAEKVNTYSDGAYYDECDSFNKPSGTNNLTVYAKVENLAANVEYLVHWYAPDGTEIERTVPTITVGEGYFGVWLELDSSCQSGDYLITVTDPLSTYICCQNVFEIVVPAEMTGSFSMPEYATKGQPIVASFTFINNGGAVITNATLVPTDTVIINHLSGWTAGDVTFNPDNPQEAIFAPRFSEVPGFGQATTTFKLLAGEVGRVSLTASASGYDKNSGTFLSISGITSNECLIQHPPNLSIYNVEVEGNPTYVYKNQKHIKLVCNLRNYGEATAVVTSASLTFDLGNQYYEQELVGYSEPFEMELAQNESVSLTFFIDVKADCPAELDNITIKALWHDKNWPVDKVAINKTKNWTVANCGIMLSADPDFNYESYGFYLGQTVYIRTFGIAPDSYYYRTRLYTRFVEQDSMVPDHYVAKNQGYSGLLSASDIGYVDHVYKIPSPGENNDVIGTWSVTLDYCGTGVNTPHTNRGPMLALQYFRVQKKPHMVASIELSGTSIENNGNIFVGDTFKAKMTVTSTVSDNSDVVATDTGAIDFVTPYGLIKDPSSFGNATMVHGPTPATFTLRAGESKTFEYVFRATEFTGNNKFRLKSSDPNYVAKGRDRNAWDYKESTPYDVFAHINNLSNGITIYAKSMGVEPYTLDFGNLSPMSEDRRFGLVCGAAQKLNMNVKKTGNSDLENISLNSSFLNGPVDPLTGIRYTISDTYFDIDTQSLSNPLTAASEMTEASLWIPFNQPDGDYSTVMFLYCDENGNGKFDNEEVAAEFEVKVYVNKCKVIKIVNNFADMGSWPRGSTTEEFTVKYFNGGNVDMERVKVLPDAVSSLTPYIVMTTPMNVGHVEVREYKTAKFKLQIPGDAPNGTYIATYTIFEDNDNNGYPNPTMEPINPEPYDTFQVKVVIGDVNFNVKNATNHTNILEASPLETSMTAISGQFAGFDHLKITNTSDVGVKLGRIKMQASDFTGTDGLGNLYTLASDVVEIYPGTLKSPIEPNESDIFDIEIYISPSVHSAHYTSTLRFYSDENNNDKWDAGEKYSDITFNIYVKPTEKVLVKEKPIPVSGMSSTVEDTVAQAAFLCHNLGNVPLKKLNFDFLNRNFVQKDVPSPFTFSTNGDSVSFDPIGEIDSNLEFVATITVRIPKNTPDGVYVLNVPCKIYNDNGGDFENPSSNGHYDSGECKDEFQIWLQIGEMKLAIPMATDVVGNPAEFSSEGPFSVKNDGALSITSITATATGLLGPGGNVVPATASIFLPTNRIGTLKQGFQSSLKWVVDIPPMTPSGDYLGKIMAWSDTKSNGAIDVGEASASADVKLSVNATPMLMACKNKEPMEELNGLELPLITNNSSVSEMFRIYNVGNVDISSPIGITKGELKNLASSIGTDNITFELEEYTTIPPGGYILATVTISLGPNILNSGVYSGDQNIYLPNVCSKTIKVSVEYGEKSLLISPKPLVFDNLENVIKKKVTGTKQTAASLKRICVYEKSACDCGLANCDKSKISMVSDQPVEIVSSKDFFFEVNVHPDTPPGWHIATWTFFDDDDNDGLYDSGEYFVDLLVKYLILERYSVTIEPSDLTVNIAPGESKDITYTVTNTGNTSLDLSECDWKLPIAAIPDTTNSYTLSNSCFVVKNAPTNEIAVGETAEYVITLTIPINQELAQYDSTMSLDRELINLGSTNISIIVEKLDTGVVVPPSTVHQLIASSTFEDQSMPYFVSAWVCPGTYSADIRSYANLSVVRYDKDGIPKAALTLRLNNCDFTPEINNLNGVSNYSLFDGEHESVGLTNEFKFHKLGEQTVYGISGDSVSADYTRSDDSKEILHFYRVYFAFDVLEPLGEDNIRILLGHSTGVGNTASSSVFFDGIKLEKAFEPNQDRPTTYHKDTTLMSPSNALDMSGKHKYYEW